MICKWFKYICDFIENDLLAQFDYALKKLVDQNISNETGPLKKDKKLKLYSYKDYKLIEFFIDKLWEYLKKYKELIKGQIYVRSNFEHYGRIQVNNEKLLKLMNENRLIIEITIEHDLSQSMEMTTDWCW